METQRPEIRVRYLVSGLPELARIGGKSDWVDLYAAERVALSAGDFRLIPLGVSIALPEGYEALIAPRSSTFVRYGLLQTNSVGVIDNSYRGDGDQWFFPAYATRDTVVEKGERICQFRILRNQPDVVFTVTQRLDSPDRGGFGSTGR